MESIVNLERPQGPFREVHRLFVPLVSSTRESLLQDA